MSSKEYGWEFIAEIKRRKLDIMFHIMGTKVETVDEKLLQALKGAGCFFIEYGFESGSQKMLDVMEKKVTVARNLEAARATKAAGLFTVPTIVLGMPGETDETVRETIEFMKKLDYGSGWYQYTYAFAVPGTPLYEYGRLTHRIPDEDRYLEAIYRATPTHFIESPDFVNFTAEPIGTVRRWPVMIKEELLKHYSRNKLDYLIRKYLRSEIFFFYMKRNGIRKTLQKILKSLSGLKTGAGAAVPQDVRYDAAVGGERGESLRKVIDRLKERSEEGLYIKASN
jgi:radical SAM superfamily enzyme YgiQ (UPF0313 family)